MTILLVVLLCSLCVAVYAQRAGKSWALGLMGISVVAALVVGGVAAWRAVSRPSRADAVTNAYQEAGRILGEQVALQFPEGGEVLVLCQPTVEGETWFTDGPLLGLRAALSNTSIRLVLGGPAIAGKPVANPEFRAMRYPELAQDVTAWLAANAQAKGVVSLLPYPPETIFSGGRSVFAFVARQLPVWEAAMRRGICKAALVDKESRSAEGVIPTWSTYFDLITPDTLSAYQKANGATPVP